VIALAAGVLAGLIGTTLGDDPDDLGVKLEQVKAQQAEYDAAMREGRRAETLSWSRPWPAEHPWLFGSAVSGGVFVVGLLVIIALTTQSKRDASGSSVDPNAERVDGIDSPSRKARSSA
jgi:hypothetical protein